MSRALIAGWTAAALVGLAAAPAVWPQSGVHVQPSASLTEGRPGSRIRVVVWTHASVGTAEFGVLHKSVEAFNRKQDVYLAELIAPMYRNYQRHVHAAATTGSLPCVLEIDGPYVRAFAWRGYLRSLNSMLPRSVREDALRSVVAQGTYDGRLYTLAQYESGLGLWANRRYLEAAGLRVPTVDAPWTQAEFETALAKLGALPGVDYALSLNAFVQPDEFYTYLYAPLVAAFGGGLLDASATRSAGVLDGRHSIAAMHRLQHWIEQGWAETIAESVTRAGGFQDGFTQRRVALSWVGHWRYSTYRDALGDALVLLPLPDFGRGVKTGMGSWSWGVASTCPHPEGARALLLHLLSAEEILRITGVNGAVPARYSAIARSALHVPGGPLRLFVQQLESGYGVPRPAVPNYGVVSHAFARAVRSIILGADVPDALRQAARMIDEDFARQAALTLE